MPKPTTVKSRKCTRGATRAWSVLKEEWRWVGLRKVRGQWTPFMCGPYSTEHHLIAAVNGLAVDHDYMVKQILYTNSNGEIYLHEYKKPIADGYYCIRNMWQDITIWKMQRGTWYNRPGFYIKVEDHEELADFDIIGPINEQLARKLSLHAKAVREADKVDKEE